MPEENDQATTTTSTDAAASETDTETTSTDDTTSTDNDTSTTNSETSAATDDEVTLPKSEVERLRRKVAEQEKAERKRQREAAEKAGDHQKVVQQVETERDEAIRERDEARAELTAFQQSGTVTQVAGRLNFHDPSDAINLLPDGVADRGEAAIESALRDLAKAKPYLVQEGSQRSGASVSGNGGGSGGTTLTAEDVKSMSRDEINERWDEVQEALKRGSGT